MSEVDFGGRTVAVTGANGLIGRHVVAALTAGNARVVEISGPASEGSGVNDGEGVQVDLRDPDAAAAALKDWDMVIHLAARAGGIQFQKGSHLDVFADNASINFNVISGALSGRAEAILIASSAVIYGPGGDLSEEDDLVTSRSERATGYAWSKVTAEMQGRWASEAGLRSVIARFTNVYGRGGSFRESSSTVIHALVKRAIDAGPGGRLVVWGDGSAVRSFIHVEDAAAAVALLLKTGETGEAYNVSSREAVSIAQLAETVRTVVDPSLEISYDVDRPSGPLHRTLDVSKLSALGFEASVGLEEGIRDVAEAYRRSTGA